MRTKVIHYEFWLILSNISWFKPNREVNSLNDDGAVGNIRGNKPHTRLVEQLTHKRQRSFSTIDQYQSGTTWI